MLKIAGSWKQINKYSHLKHPFCIIYYVRDDSEDSATLSLFLDKFLRKKITHTHKHVDTWFYINPIFWIWKGNLF